MLVPSPCTRPPLSQLEGKSRGGGEQAGTQQPVGPPRSRSPAPICQQPGTPGLQFVPPEQEDRGGRHQGQGRGTQHPPSACAMAPAPVCCQTKPCAPNQPRSIRPSCLLLLLKRVSPGLSAFQQGDILGSELLHQLISY